MIVYARLPVAPTLSVAVTVKVKVAALDGVPVDAPLVELSASPPGNAPAVIEKVTVPVPPVALIVCAYVIPTVPLGSVAGFTTSAAAITRVYARDPVAPSVSVPVIVKLNVPAVLAVPEIAPLAAFSDHPVGSEPAVTANATAPVPPVELTLCE